MDLLSHILKGTRARTPLIADLRLSDDMSLGIPHSPGIPFHYVVEGRCSLVLPSQAIDLGAGDFVMMPRWPDYRIETGEGRIAHEISDFDRQHDLPADFREAGLERPLLTQVGESAPVTRLLSASVLLAGQRDSPLTSLMPDIILLQNARAHLDPWLIAAIDFVSVERDHPEPGYAVVADRLIELIFVGAVRQWVLQSSHDRGWMRGLSDRFISRALNAMHADPGRSWSLTEMAAMAGRSRSGFAQHFHTIMGETPFAYLTRWRMHLASLWLTERNLSLAQIASDLGYGSTTAFSRIFLRRLGTTPSQYRKAANRDAKGR